MLSFAQGLSQTFLTDNAFELNEIYRGIFRLWEIKMKRSFLIICGMLSLCFTSVANATDYKFTVSCSHDRFAIVWQTGDIDPGMEWLRVATGTKHPNCSVSDFNPGSDGNLRVADRYSHEGGVVEGVPLIGPIICGIFGC